MDPWQNDGQGGRVGQRSMAPGQTTADLDTGVCTWYCAPSDYVLHLRNRDIYIYIYIFIY